MWRGENGSRFLQKRRLHSILKGLKEDLLVSEFKVNVIDQIPNSPETNMLDLGAWMSIQAQVQKEHFRKVENIATNSLLLNFISLLIFL